MNTAKFLSKKFLQLQFEQERKITVKEFGDMFGISQALMTRWMNGTRKPTPKYKALFFEYFGDEGIEAFGDDTDLYAVQQAWKDLSAKERTTFRKKIVETAKENLYQRNKGS